jgi:hypothetical protein
MVFDNETVCFGFSDAYALTVARSNFDAQTCASGSKHHVYIHQNGLSIIFNNIFQWVAIKENSQSEHRAADSLHHKEKATVEKLVKALANGNWKDLIHEYDGERSLDFNPSLQGSNYVTN